MPTNRKIIFANGEYYHVFNRGVEKRLIFTNKREFERALLTINYYKHSNPPVRYSRFISLNASDKTQVINQLSKRQLLVEIIAFCLMPNHFHFLLRQVKNNGISQFIANFTNSYTKYFNVKHDRVGHLFQGQFKAVYVENDEQLLHLSRYIHLNPLKGFLVKKSELDRYVWSSFPDYINMGKNLSSISNSKLVIDLLGNENKYKEFVISHFEIGQEIIEPLMFEE